MLIAQLCKFALGTEPRLVMDGALHSPRRGHIMAEQHSIPNSPTHHEMTEHVRDYSRFITMFKWGAIICSVIGFAVLLIIG